MNKPQIEIPYQALEVFCCQNQIRKLAFFGSVVRDDFSPASDIDVLVEFKPEARIGLFGLIGLEQQLSQLFNRRVDLNTPDFLSPYFRVEVIKEAVTEFDAA